MRIGLQPICAFFMGSVTVGCTAAKPAGESPEDPSIATVAAYVSCRETLPCALVMEKRCHYQRGRIEKIHGHHGISRGAFVSCILTVLVELLKLPHMGTLTYKFRNGESVDFLFDDDVLVAAEPLRKAVVHRPNGCYLYFFMPGEVRVSAAAFALGSNIPMEVDHKNRDTTDNRRCNLRACSHQQNMYNRNIKGNKTPGVHYEKGRNVWSACVTFSKDGVKRKMRSRHKTKDEAVAKRKEYELLLGMRWEVSTGSTWLTELPDIALLDELV